MINRIAVPCIGFRNAGKSTIVSALLQGHYTQTSAKPCTSAVFQFHVHEPDDNLDPDGEARMTLAQIQETIRKVNECSVKKTSELGEERTFSIRLREPLCKKMHRNFQLDILDLPGIDELIGLASPLKDYIVTKWDTFGCEVVVIDVLSASLDRQLNLLTEVSKINVDKDVPILVVGNKVDSIHQDGVKEKIDQIKRFIDRTFSASKVCPEFINLSARDALYARCAHKLALEKFKQGYGPQVDQIGTSIMSDYQWSKIEPKKKVKEIHGKLKEEYEGRMESSNFRFFCEKLDARVGGDKQPLILKRVLEAQLKKLTFSIPGWENEFCSISERLCKVGNGAFDRENIMSFFWAQLQEHIVDARHIFRSTGEFGKLANTFELLQVASDKLKAGRDLVQQEYKTVTLHYFETLREKFNEFIKMVQRNIEQDDTPHKAKKARLVAWGKLSAFDWKTIFSTLLEVDFAFHFPNHYRFIKDTLACYGEDWGLTREQANYMKGTYGENAVFKPKNKSNYSKYSRLPALNDKNATNPDHWGHIPWLYVKKV